MVAGGSGAAVRQFRFQHQSRRQVGQAADVAIDNVLVAEEDDADLGFRQKNERRAVTVNGAVVRNGLCLRNLPTMKPSPKPISSSINCGVHIWASVAGETICLSPAMGTSAAPGGEHLTTRAKVLGRSKQIAGGNGRPGQRPAPPASMKPPWPSATCM